MNAPQKLRKTMVTHMDGSRSSGAAAGGGQRRCRRALGRSADEVVDEGQQRPQPVGSCLLHARPLQAQALQILHNASHTAASFHVFAVPHHHRHALVQVWLLHVRWSVALSSNSNGPGGFAPSGSDLFPGQGAGGTWPALAQCTGCSKPQLLRGREERTVRSRRGRMPLAVS